MPWLADRSPTPRMSASRRGQQPAISSTRASASVSSMRISSPIRPAIEPELGLQLVEQRVDEPDVARRFDLGDDDDVDGRAGPADDLDEIVVAPHGVDAVDPDGACLGAPVELVQGADDRTPRGNLGVGRHGVLEIEEHQVGFARRRLRHHLVAGAGCRELGAAQAHRSCHVDLLRSRRMARRSAKAATAIDG